MAEKLGLSGEWRFALDPKSVGINFCGGWYGVRLPETVRLPGTAAGNGKGVRCMVDDVDNVGEDYAYVGAAWYQRDVEIPEQWRDRCVRLVLPRTARTMVWMDCIPLGENTLIQAPQCYELGAAASPGLHTLTIRVDNSPVRPMNYGNPSRCENGLEGELRLEAREKVYVRQVRVTPLPERNRARVEAVLRNESGIPAGGVLTIRTECNPDGPRVRDKSLEFLVEEQEKTVWFELYLGENFRSWDEFHPNRYRLEVSLHAENRLGRWRDTAEAAFGMRCFESRGGRLFCNDKAVFLRGDAVGAATFRHMGGGLHSLEFWRSVMEGYRAYGINHLRFHTWCPPEEAFAAADEFGFYLQPELTCSGYVNFPEEEAFEPLLEAELKRQGGAILSAYGNHPSFVMLTLGNEIEGDYRMLGRVVAHLRAIDSTRLYAQGSNNNLNDPFPLEGEDFLITNKARKGPLMMRGSCAYADYPVGMVQNKDAPDTFRGYAQSMEGYAVPVISHELGQYETSPNFDDLKDFPEGKEPRNLKLFQQRMEEKGLLPREKEFFEASCQLAALCYKEDMEMACRTPQMCGFQLLALNDILGQGSSLVGARSITGRPKAPIPASLWKTFCNSRVLLLGMERYVYPGGGLFEAEVRLANFGEGAIPDARVAVAITENGKPLFEQVLAGSVEQGERHCFGRVSFRLPDDGTARRLTVSLSLLGTEVRNEYPIWVYPALHTADDCVVTRLDADARKRLEEGEALLLMPGHINPLKSVEGSFASNFWSYAMFRNLSLERGVEVDPATLGICAERESPLFRGFPTETGTNWQWWQSLHHARPVLLDGLPAELRPLVAVIDNPMRGEKLGLLFEVRAGGGRILFSAVDFNAMENRDPASDALFESMKAYVRSTDFQPKTEAEIEAIAELSAP